MIFLKRKRLMFWLVKAYFRRWRKTIFLSFVLGLGIFFLLIFGSRYLNLILPFKERQTIGIVGAYTTDNLPASIFSNVSRGLTKISKNGTPEPDIAQKWIIKDNGKKFIFYLKKDVYFSDGTNLTASSVRYNFKDVKVEIPSKYVIIFTLKNSYSPFLVTVSRPIFKDEFVGAGSYKIKSLNLNGSFVQSIDLVPINKDASPIVYHFYPTEEALKMAFILGEVTKVTGLSDTKFKDKNFKDFKNATVEKTLDDSKLVTLFYNTQDSVLSDKRLREALSYSIPDQLNYGQRNYTPYPADFWLAQDPVNTYIQDLEHAKTLLSQSESSSKSAGLKLTVKTLEKYKPLAQDVKKTWEKLGIETRIETVESLPSKFQIFLGDFNPPKDPDQYTLWHSDQPNNITNYKNLRIDKLLEDGRQTADNKKREKIYLDFQKYLLDDAPATFILYPYTYDLIRK